MSEMKNKVRVLEHQSQQLKEEVAAREGRRGQGAPGGHPSGEGAGLAPRRDPDAQEAAPGIRTGEAEGKAVNTNR